MDIRSYFQQIRQIEGSLPEDGVVVVSLATRDGGKAGRLMELDRSLAARMIADHRVRSATAEESEQYRAVSAAEEQEHRARAVEPRVQFMADLIAIRKQGRKQDPEAGGE